MGIQAPAEVKYGLIPVSYTHLACPRCGRHQKGNRDSCYACGLPFQYEHE